MNLQEFLQSFGKKKKRKGRGLSSGSGKTAGRGTKGQKARKSGHTRPGFEGGQTPIYRRLPKRGARRSIPNPNHAFRLINIAAFEKDEKILSGQTLDFSQEKRSVKV